MKYKTIPENLRPPLNGKYYWLWRLARTRLEELPWILKRIFKINHLTSGYYETPAHWVEHSKRAEEIALNIRGDNYKPAIFVHGIMPRCGSNIVHDILDNHPDVIGRELGISEFPVLCNSRAMDAFFASVVARHRKVAENVSGIEAMAFFASGWMADIQARIGQEKTAVIKMPSVQHLELFNSLFPRDKLVIVVRDGRDILQSTLDSWKDSRTFMRSESAIAREYAAAAKEITAFTSRSKSDEKLNFHLFRYEDYIASPSESATELYTLLDLNFDESVVTSSATLPLRGSSTAMGDAPLDWEPKQKPLDFQPTRKWKQWTTQRKNLFSSIAGQALKDLGYDNSAN